MSQPALELRDIASLIPYAKNSNTHPAAQIAKIEALIAEFGWTNPILIDENGVIVAGHGRIMAASNIYKRGELIRFPSGDELPAGKVPVLSCAGWTDAQRRAYVIADNRIAQDSTLDLDVVALELADLKADGFDLSLTAFEEGQIGELLNGLLEPEEGNGDPDDAPEAPDVPVTQPGDVWVLGAHRVCCGSATEPNDWDRLLQGEHVDAIWTDPPYNVDQGKKNAEQDKWDGGSRSKTGGISNDKLSDAEFFQFLLDAHKAMFNVVKPGAPIYVAHSDIEGVNFRKAFADAGFKFQSCIIWHKNVHVLGRWDYQAKHEPILYGWRPGSRHRWYGGRKQTSIIELGDGGPFTRLPDGRVQIKVGDSVMVVSADAMVEESPSSVLYEAKPSKSGLHPTQKPVNLIERMLKHSARKGDIVADAFGGSGSTLIAADRLGMCARLMELDPRFVDVIVRRWEQFTGRRAVHAQTGEFFPADGEPRTPPAMPAILVDEVSADVF